MRQELMSSEPDMSVEDAEVVVEGRNILVEYARMSKGRQSGIPQADWTFGSKLQRMIER